MFSDNPHQKLLDGQDEAFGGSGKRLPPFYQHLLAVGINAIVVGFGALVVPYSGYMVVGTVFLLAGIYATLWLDRWPLLLLAILNVLTWDFLFVPPVFTFEFEKLEDLLFCGMILIVVLGTFMVLLKHRDVAERQSRLRTAALLNVTQSAALAADPNEGLTMALLTIKALLRAEAALIVRNEERQLPQKVHQASTFTPAPSEWAVITHSYLQNLTSGKFTDYMPQAEATWFPLRTASSVMGVLGIRLTSATTMDFSTQQTITAFALQLALVLEKEQFVQALKKTEVADASEKLRHTLLDSISHELKTPLAALQSAMEEMNASPAEATRYLPELRSALRRMNRTVDNLLNMTRLESGAISPLLDWCDVDELCDAAVDLIGDALIHHRFYLNVPKTLPMVKVDRALMEQALVNFLLNASMHTPQGTEVVLRAQINGKALLFSVEDRGPGLPNVDPESLFQKFARGERAPAGGSGLGLAIARGFARAHGGDASAFTRPEGGAEFRLTIPVDILDDFTHENRSAHSSDH
jgi:two-component system, OmpR family, sensor histidine kinase KdpD